MIKIKKRFLKNFIIDINSKVFEGLKKLQNTKYNLIIVYKNDSFVGVLQGGDIRRKLISKTSLEAKIAEVFNKKCVFFYSETKNINLKIELIRKDKKMIEGIPIINKKTRKLVDLYIFSKDHSFFNDYSIVVMAGGKGTRMKKLTKNTPKPLLKTKKKPILEHIFNNIKKNRYKKIYVTTKYQSNKIRNFINIYSKKNKVSIQEIKEKKFLGTAGCLKLLKEKVFGKIILVNGDVIANINYIDLINHHELYKNDITVCSKEDVFNIPYGLLKKSKNNNFFIDEKPNFLLRYNIGIYVINPDSFKIIKPNKYIDMPDFINQAQKNKFKIGQYNIIENISHYTSPEDLKN
jgi:choline kinase